METDLWRPKVRRARWCYACEFHWTTRGVLCREHTPAAEMPARALAVGAVR